MLLGSFPSTGFTGHLGNPTSSTRKRNGWNHSDAETQKKENKFMSETKTTTEKVSVDQNVGEVPDAQPFRVAFLKAIGVHAWPGFTEEDRIQDGRLCAIYYSASDTTRRALDAAFMAVTKGETLKSLLKKQGQFAVE
jgi:hypothetical protein